MVRVCVHLRQMYVIATAARRFRRGPGLARGGRVVNPLSSPTRPTSHTTPARLRVAALAGVRGGRTLFKNLDFEVGVGQLLWLRGQNGCGKTSLLRLAAGLARPEHGEVLWDGRDARRVERAGRPLFIGHANALKEDLTLIEALGFLLRIHGRPHDGATLHAALDQLDLNHRRHAPVRTLSQGQRRRAALARLAVERHASLWILDEPFDALDADGVQRVDGLLRAHLRRGGSVLLTSHLPPGAALLQPIELHLDRRDAPAANGEPAVVRRA